MEIILYTTRCPQCKMVEALLRKNNIEYIECTSSVEMTQRGINHVPVLSVDNLLYTGAEIFSWLNSQKGVSNNGN